eukprot:3693848-Amphidinium_carterae.1
MGQSPHHLDVLGAVVGLLNPQRSLQKGARLRLVTKLAIGVSQVLKNCRYFDVLEAVMGLHERERPLQSVARLRRLRT